MPAKNQCFYGSGTPLSRQYRNADHDCEIPVLVRALLHQITLASDAAWKRSGTTVESLAKELRLALQYPEGAAV